MRACSQLRGVLQKGINRMKHVCTNAGFLTLEELGDWVRNLGDSNVTTNRLKRMIDQVDESGKGYILSSPPPPFLRLQAALPAIHEGQSIWWKSECAGEK